MKNNDSKKIEVYYTDFTIDKNIEFKFKYLICFLKLKHLYNKELITKEEFEKSIIKIKKLYNFNL